MMNSNSIRPFRNPSYIDYLVGWKFLFNKDYRASVQERWEEQPWFITGAEIITGIGSIVFSTILAFLFLFIVLDAWFI